MRHAIAQPAPIRRGDSPYTDRTIPIRRQPPARGGPSRQPGRPRALWPKIRLALVIALGLLIALLIWLYLQVGAASGRLVVADARPSVPASWVPLGINLLIIGVDERPGAPEEGVRSDTLIVAHLDPGGRRVSLLSIPRDTRVTIPNFGVGKINTAYGYGYGSAAQLFGDGASPRQGGMALAAQTVQDFLGIPIHYTAQVNFDGFASVIDALGGITIDVPRAIRDDEYPTPDFGVTTIEFQPGVQQMDGARALIYARTRHADSDFGRAERQQQVIDAIVARLRERGPLGAASLAGSLGETFDGAVLTTLPFARLDALAALGFLASGLSADNVGRFALSPQSAPSMVEDGSDLVWDPAEVQAVVAQFLDAPAAAAPQRSATVQVFNATATPGLARRVAGELESAGFTVLESQNAVADAPKTVVYDRTGNPDAAKRLARRLKCAVVRGEPDGIPSTADLVVVLGADTR